MTEGVPEQAARAFADHSAFEESEESKESEKGGADFTVGTTGFDAGVRIEDADEPALRYRVLVELPTLSAAVEGAVADVVEEGWFDTFSLRLDDAAMAVPGNAEIPEPDTRVEGDTVVVETTVREGSADRAPRTAKAIVDYVEGTYVEGVVPGYEYRPPVSDLLASARHDAADGPDSESDSDVNAGGPMPM
jgi:hypothetical protein